MSGTEETDWKIPYGLSYDKLTKIPRILLQKKADSNPVSMNSIAPLIPLPLNFLSTNMSFLKSIGVVDGDNDSGYKLTDLGIQYAHAISKNEDAVIKKLTLEMIEKSHLHDLKVLTESEGEKITKERILKVIKTNAKISDGIYAGEMPRQSSDGANAIVQILNVAGLVSDELAKTKLSRQGDKSPKPPKAKTSVGSTPQKSTPALSGFNLNSHNFDISISDSIDEEELDFIKSQIDSLIEFARKKISAKQNDNTAE